MSAFAEPPEHDGDGFIAKPFDIDELEEAFARYVDSSMAKRREGLKEGQSRRRQRARR
jgi:hypothetical protein